MRRTPVQGAYYAGRLLRGTPELGEGVGVECFPHPQVEVEIERLNLRRDGREKRRRGAGCSCSARPSLGRGCVAAIECWPRGWGCGFHTLTNASFNSLSVGEGPTGLARSSD